MNKISQNIKSKMMNKKHLMAPICLLLMVTMIMMPVAARATTTWLQSVENSSNVTNPQYIVGTSADGNCARFNPTQAKLIGPLRTSPSTSVTPGIYAYTTSGTGRVYMYMTYDCNGPWAPAGYADVGTTPGMYWSNNAAPGNNGGFSVNLGNGVSLYADYAAFKY
ncbi:MAG: hypothetical protein FWH37_10230 [Candidatus Bathyarchaeota archaeon]|nr:hypothetical protein [Candidatus Termiticorpusculum sp.]